MESFFGIINVMGDEEGEDIEVLWIKDEVDVVFIINEEFIVK